MHLWMVICHIQFWVILTSDLISRFLVSGAFPQMCLILDHFLWVACLVQSSYKIFVLRIVIQSLEITLSAVIKCILFQNGNQKNLNQW